MCIRDRIGSVAFLVGVGGSPLMSIRMGEGNLAQARKILANCFLLLNVLAVLLMAGALLTRRPLLLLFGASETTLPYALDYYTYYLFGTVFALSLIHISANQIGPSEEGAHGVAQQHIGQTGELFPLYLP